MEEENQTRNKKQCLQAGMITVEVCTILFIFTFAMLAILCAIRMIQTQVFVQSAVNQTAKEVSQYSYLLYRIGYVDMVQKQNGKKEELQKNIDSFKEEPVNAVTELFSALQKGDTTMKGEADNIISGILGVGYSSIMNGANNYTIGNITKNILKDYCSKINSSTDILKDMGVQGGIGKTTDEGVKIQVEYCTDKEDKNKFTIQADYIYVIDYPFLDRLEIPCRAVASTAIWGGGEEVK